MPREYILPVGHKSVFFAPEHYANVSGVMDGRVKVGIISDFSWKVHFCFGLMYKSSKIWYLKNGFMVGHDFYLDLSSTSFCKVGFSMDNKLWRVFLASLHAFSSNFINSFKVCWKKHIMKKWRGNYKEKPYFFEYILIIL